MNIKSIVIITCFLFSAQVATACDETCKKEIAETKHSTSFPSYLSWQYCDSLKQDFMTIDVKSLESYSSKHFDTTYKGPIKNTIKFIDDRKDWLNECDNYITLTRSERIFHDTKTTELVFAKMDAVSSELKGVLRGVTYSSETGDETDMIVGEKFTSLFQSVNDHMNLMHLKGKYVYK